MFFSVNLFALSTSMLYYIILFHVGSIINTPHQLRKFLGLKSTEEEKNEFKSISILVQKIGLLIKIMAAISIANIIIKALYAIGNSILNYYYFN